MSRRDTVQKHSFAAAALALGFAATQAAARQVAEIQNLVDAAKQAIGWNAIVEVEEVEELVLRATSLTHHRDALPPTD